MKYLPKILLVDDEVDHLHLLTALLRGHGFDVYSLSNPDEIFAIIKTFKPKIIIMDVKMGSYNGKEICAQLKADEETKSIKVTLHSAFPEIEQEYKLCGADDFIIKPTHISDLISRLNFHLK
jgi:two-component system, OmpR family, phosphate regulon response regulator PhoB